MPSTMIGRPAGYGGNHRQAGGHPLDHDLAERLGADRGVDQDVELGQLGPHVVPVVSSTRSVSCSDPIWLAQPLHVRRFPEHRVADQPEFGLAGGERLREGLEHDVALPLRQPPDDPDPEPMPFR